MKLDRYLKHQRLYEAFFAFGLVILIVVVNATTGLIENARLDTGQKSPTLIWIDEATSGLIVLALVPLLVIVADRIKPAWSQWRRTLILYSLLFLLFTFAHVTGMFTLRWLMYTSLGHSFSMDTNWFNLFLYESRKDLLTYLLIIAIGHAYAFILDRLQGEANFLSEEPKAYRERFLVKMLQKEYLVAIEDVDWVQSARNYVLLHSGERAYPMRSTMQAIGEELNPEQFLRVHRTAFVNLQRIKCLTDGQSPDCEVELTNGTRVPVSRTYLPQLKADLAETGP